MKKVIILFLTIISFDTSIINSQWVSYIHLGDALYFIRFQTNQEGFSGGNCSLFGQSVIYHIYQGGPLGTVMQTHTNFIFYGFHFTNFSNFYLCGSGKSIVKGASGVWGFETVTKSSTGNFYDIYFPSITTGYAVGDPPDNIYKSTNNGYIWQSVNSSANSTLKGLYFIDDLTGWVCGNNGTILKTTDGGVSWSIQSPSAVFNFDDILFINSNTGVAAGTDGSIYKTVNGGLTWIAKQSNVTANLNCVYFYPPNYLWAAGWNGKIIKSTDTGETWFLQNTNNSTEKFNDIYFPSLSTGDAVSSEGNMYKTTISGGGIVGIIYNEVPLKFELKQNFPNPFNPVTQIEYSLIKSANVTLVVYDVTGRIVSTLVNEHQNTGTHTIDFDGSNLASGIYIYKISAGDFTDIKKMILMK